MKASVCVPLAIVMVIAPHFAPTASADQPAPLQCPAGFTFDAQMHKCVSSVKPPNAAAAATTPAPLPRTSIPHPVAVESPTQTKQQECSALANGVGGTVPTNSVAKWNALNCGPLPVIPNCTVGQCSSLANGCTDNALQGNFCGFAACNAASCASLGFPGVPLGIQP